MLSTEICLSPWQNLLMNLVIIRVRVRVMVGQIQF